MISKGVNCIRLGFTENEKHHKICAEDLEVVQLFIWFSALEIIFSFERTLHKFSIPNDETMKKAVMLSDRHR
jgi:hypothetical protein